MAHAHVCSWNVHVIYAFHVPFGSCRHLSQSSSIIFGWTKARLSQHCKWTHWLINIHINIIVYNCELWCVDVSQHGFALIDAGKDGPLMSIATTGKRSNHVAPSALKGRRLSIRALHPTTPPLCPQTSNWVWNVSDRFSNSSKTFKNQTSMPDFSAKMHQASPSRETCFMYLYDSLCIFTSYDVTLRLEMLIDWPWPTCRGASKPNWRQHCTNCLEKPTPIFELSHVHTNDY